MPTVTLEATGTPLFTAENGGPDFAELAPLVITGVFPDANPSVQLASNSARIVFSDRPQPARGRPPRARYADLELRAQPDPL